MKAEQALCCSSISDISGWVGNDRDSRVVVHRWLHIGVTTRTSFETVEQEAQESDFGEPEPHTRVVRLKIEITSVFESPIARSV